MKNIVKFSSVVLLFTSIYAQNMQLSTGWQMKGTETGFSTMQAFNQDCIQTVWSYDTTNKSWRAYSPKITLTQSIIDNTSITPLTTINKDEGFWVNTDYNCAVVKEGNVSQPTVIYQTDALYPLATPFTLDMIANKTFNFRGDLNITFDANGVASNGFAYYPDSNLSLSLNSQGELVDNLSSSTSSLKILAYDANVGFILVNRYYDNYAKNFYEYVLSMTLDTAVENPVDMSTKLPYTIFNGYDLKNKPYTQYDVNGSIGNFSNNNQSYGTQTFSITDGKIVTSDEYNDTSYSYSSKTSFQIVFTIGEYDILSTTGDYTNTSKTIYYTDVNNTQQSVELNSSIATFYDLFTLTNNTYNGIDYNLTSNTIAFPNSNQIDGNFTISSDGKTLTQCFNYSPNCNENKLQNDAITSSDHYHYYEPVKTTPFY